jgi:phosphoglycolate phosphatase-like HAD superfamily hydrolase
VLYLLWDIDGTLLSTARAGVFALEEAARGVLGFEVDLQSMRTAGLTDAAIARLVLERHGGDTGPAGVERFLRLYEQALPERLGLREGRVLDRVHDALEALRARDDVLNLLLTGNVERGARAKLRHYGLDGYFDDGAFCVTDHGREAIAERAAALVARHAGGAAPPGDRMVVIGDTPHDVSCGKSIGARTLAVATGGATLAELQACDPWLAVETLPEPARLFELLGLDGPTRR